MRSTRDQEVPKLGPDPEPLGTERSRRLLEAIEAQFERVDTVVGSRAVRWIEETDLGLHEVRVLLTLAEAGHAITPREIADRSGLQIDSAYRAVHSLHCRGLTDEKSRHHELSDDGRRLIDSFRDARRRGVEAFVAQLDDDERRRLERVLPPTPGP